MIDTYTAQGYWGTMTLGDYLDHHAAYSPDRVAFIDARSRVTFGEWKRISDRIALWMLEQGLLPEDRIGLQTPNWVEYFYVRLACAKIGVVPVPLIFNHREHEIEYMLSEAKAVAFFVCSEFGGFDYIDMVRRLQPRLPALRQLVALGPGRPPGLTHLDDIVGTARETRYSSGHLLAYHPSANDIDILMSTSGSTGRPKLVLRTPNVFITLGHHIVERARMTRDEVVLSVAPVNQGTGYSVAVVAALIVGCTNVLLERFDPGEALRLIERERVTMTVGVPAHMIKMMSEPGIDGLALSSLRLFYHAGAPLPREAAEEFVRTFGCRLMEAYGALDGGTPVHTLIEDPPDKVYGTVGKACPGMELRIVDDDGRRLPPGEAGEVVYRGPNCAVGLLNDPGHAYDADGWFHSGDLGVLDEEGYLRIVGRKKNIIIRGGQNISPTEVEDGLSGHPDLLNVAVVRMPDPVMGEKACAFVVARRPLTVEDLARHLEARHFAKYKIPERVEHVDELPLLPNGKIDRVALERIIAEKVRSEGAPR